MTMDINFKVPKEADNYLGEFFEATINDTKKTIQCIANDIISKDLQKIKRHACMMKREEKDHEQERKWIADLNEKVIDEWKVRCASLESELELIKKQKRIN